MSVNLRSNHNAGGPIYGVVVERGGRFYPAIVVDDETKVPGIYYLTHARAEEAAAGLIKAFDILAEMLK
jgi:hypothetical protein